MPSANHRPQDIWIEQCDAARGLSERHGLKASFDYLVGEKLMAFMEAAVRYPEFARALPLFVSEVRRTFDPGALREHLTRIEREHTERAAIEMEGEDCEFFQDAHENERWEARFDLMKDLLTAEQLGTS